MPPPQPPQGGTDHPPSVAAPREAEGPNPPMDSGVLSQAWSAISSGVSAAVRPEAAAQVATTFGFPLALMIAVIIFLIVQDRVDRRDPKLRSAPRTYFDTVVRFREESEL